MSEHILSPLTDHNFKEFFLIDKLCVLNQISLNFVPKSPSDSITWRKLGDEPLSSSII